MLKFLRKRRNLKIVLWILVIAVIVTFVFTFGPASLIKQGKSNQPKYAGIIFGKKISLENFLKSRHYCYYQALMIYGKNLSKIIDYINLDEQAWDRLILLEEVKRRKITVSNEEVIKEIKQMPLFKEGDKFDPKRYKVIVTRYFKTDPRSFEEETRKNMQISKLYEDLVKDVSISDEELERLYKEENEQIKVSYTLIASRDFKDEVKVDESKLRKFYENNKTLFKVPLQVNVEYLPITVELTEDEVEVTEEELKAFYENNKEDFKKENQNMDNKKTENVKSEYKDFTEVKDDIKKILVNEKSKDKALDIAIEIKQMIDKGGEFNKIAKEYSIPIKESGFFSKVQSIPDIGWSYEFVNTAFNLKTNEISDIIELPNGYYILKLKDKKEPYIPEYNQVKQKVKEAYINKQSQILAKEKAQEYLRQLQDKMNSGLDFKQAVESLSLKIETTDFFARNDYIKGIGKSEEFKRAAFDNKDGRLSNVIKVARGYAILKVEEFKPIDNKKFQEEKESFREKVLEKKKIETFNTWFNNLKKEANLKSFI